MSDDQQWWHVYGGTVVLDGDPEPAWYCKIVNSTTDPDHVSPGMAPSFGRGNLRWMASMDHEPSDSEKAELVPEEWQ